MDAYRSYTDGRMTMNNTGYFIVSLDFELMWGVHDVTTLEAYSHRLLCTRKAIPQLLSLFDRYEIHATWATVGMLFASDKKQIMDNIPENDLLPSYDNTKHSSYNYLTQVGNSEKDDPYHFASSLIEEIRKHDFQEIGSHTYSHYYCKEEGQTQDQFQKDLEINRALVKDSEMVSIVFPRNQCNPNYLSTCKENGFLAYRGMENTYINRWNFSEKVKRFLRFVDSYFNISGNHCYKLSDALEDNSEMINLKSSCFLRPYVPERKKLERFKISRIKKQMLYAAKHKEVFHMWWHPHNMGENTTEFLTELEDIFRFANELNHLYGFQSANMGEIIKIINCEDM